MAAGALVLLTLVSPTAAVRAQQTVPASAKDYRLIGYVAAG